ncbi:hypothetical protein [Halobellus captivus]|uniref:hypothetical protein n=1 Tax=Halobellus captivus TaxID=2592614 RepID=UPI0011A7E462|nr:hypothetical protein [Halobellus captivus]
MVVDLIRVFSGTRSETVFLPPALLGYISYLKQDWQMFLVTATVVVAAAVIHDIAEEIENTDGDDETVKFEISSHWVPQTAIRVSLVIYGISSIALVPVLVVYEFYQTYNLYLGIGIFLYLILGVKLLRPVKRYRVLE